MPGTRCTRSLACEIKKHTSKSPQDQTESADIPCAMVLTAYSALFPVTGLSCHRRPRFVFADLASASGCQNHTPSPYANASVVSRKELRLMLSRPPHPAPNVYDDRETPLSRGAGCAKHTLILISEKQKYFLQEGWTGFCEPRLSGKSLRGLRPGAG
jgi:hypothetical protein